MTLCDVRISPNRKVLPNIGRSESVKNAAEARVPGSMSGSLAKAPFDIIGDTLRGTRGIMMEDAYLFHSHEYYHVPTG
jgi:hypothetical protein